MRMSGTCATIQCRPLAAESLIGDQKGPCDGLRPPTARRSWPWCCPHAETAPGRRTLSEYLPMQRRAADSEEREVPASRNQVRFHRPARNPWTCPAGPAGR